MHNSNDQEWLDILAGKVPSDEDEQLAINAEALRAAIIKYDQKLSSQRPEMDHGLEKLKFRLRREGLFDGPRKSLRDFAFSNVIPFDFPVLQWSIAASVFIVVGMLAESMLHDSMTQNEMNLGGQKQFLSTNSPAKVKGLSENQVQFIVNQNKNHEQLTLSNSQMAGLKDITTTKVHKSVENPLRYLSELENVLNFSGAEYNVTRLKSGGVTLSIQLNEKVVEVLKAKDFKVGYNDHLISIEISNIKADTISPKEK